MFKKTSRSINWLSVCGVVAAAATVQAEGDQPGFYVRADVGPAFTEDAGFGGINTLPPGAEVQFDTGVRFSGAGGYTFNEWLAAELETGFAYNSIDRITGATFVDAAFSSSPLLANVVLQYPNRTRFVPFIGGGLGVSFSVLDIDVISGPGNTFLTGDDVDAVFAYQGFVGVRYNINDRMDVGVTYKYLGTDDPSWEVFPSGKLRLNDIRTHSFSFAFRFKF